MWVTKKYDEQSIYWNLNQAQEIRFLKLGVLLDGYQEVLKQHGISRDEFGDPESMVMAVIGPAIENFRILVSLPNDEQQARKIAAVEEALRTGIETGKKLLNLKKVVEEA